MTYTPKKYLPLFCALLLATSANISMARCKMEPMPVIPESADISLEELKTIKREIDNYMAVGQDYVNCQRREKKIDAAIQEMRLVAANYNVLIMLYKENLTDEELLQLSNR